MTDDIDIAVWTEADTAMLKMVMHPGVEYVDLSDLFVDDDDQDTL